METADRNLDVLEDPGAEAILISEPGFSRRFARMPLRREERTEAYRPLVPGTERFAPPQVREWHRAGHRPLRPAPACYFATDAVISGSGQVMLDGRLLGSSEFMPDYLWDELGFGPARQSEVHVSLSKPKREIEGPCVVLMSYGIHVYGHFLIEMLPQLLLARRALAGAGLEAGLLVEQRAEPWLLRILTEELEIDPAAIELYDARYERVLLHNAILPALVNSPMGFHPFMNELLATLISDLDVKEEPARRTGRIFISRHLLGEPRAGRWLCTNEEDLAEIAAERGFGIVAPEELSWRDQIALFRDATAIVGEYGSGLHNALFSPAGTRVGSVGVLNRALSYIGALRGHDSAFLRVPGQETPGDYEVDVDEFGAFLAALTAGLPDRPMRLRPRGRTDP